MSDFEPKPNTMSMFKSTSTNEKAPLLNGKMSINLTEFMSLISNDKDGNKILNLEFSLWSKVGKTGTAYWSGVVKKPYEKEESSREMPPHRATDTTSYSDGTEFTESGLTPPPVQESTETKENDLPF